MAGFGRGKAFAKRSSESWGAANRIAGTDEATVVRNVANTLAFYTGDPAA